MNSIQILRLCIPYFKVIVDVVWYSITQEIPVYDTILETIYDVKPRKPWI
jgi:uncharacterized protein with HEPN domain